MKILLAGYYGYQNAGDEACLHQTTHLLQRTYVNPDIHIIYPGKNQPSINAYVNRFSMVQMVKAISKCDMVIFGGGGLLQDKTSCLSLYYYLVILIFARWRSKKTLLLSQGLGPFHKPFSKKITAWVLRHVTAITLRDKTSYDMAASLIGDRNHIYLSADMALADGPQPFPKPSTLVVGISIRKVSLPQGHWKMISEWIKTLVTKAVFLSFQSPEDTTFFQSLDPSFTSIPIWDMTQKWPSWPEISIVVGMRYHSVVGAALCGCPCLALAYDDKVLSIAEALEQPVIDVRQQGLTLSLLESTFNETLYRYDFLKDQIHMKTKSLIKRLSINQTVLASVI